MNLLSERFKLKLTYFTKLPAAGVWCQRCELIWELGDPVFLSLDREREDRLFCAKCGGPVRGMPNEVVFRKARSVEGKVLAPDGFSGCHKCGSTFRRGDEVFREQYLSDAGAISEHPLFRGEKISDAAFVRLVCGDCGEKGGSRS